MPRNSTSEARAAASSTIARNMVDVTIPNHLSAL
jgi:hypothetical protein